MVTVAIKIAGVDVTADVVFENTRFKSYVNSKPGEARMRVRDSARTYSFTTGADWLVLVNGEAAWRGFVTSVVDTYIAEVINVPDFGPTRFFDLIGADLNLLFSRRIVYDQATPENVAGTQFPPATADTTAITELLANWLLLSGDDLDTASGVTHVGDLDPAQTTRAWSGSWEWGQAMDSIAMLPAAIYYLRPEATSPKGTLCYVDVDVPTAPFGLSDRPNGTTTKGYREMEITLDGSSLANDVMAWGMGYGSQTPVFKRDQDATSQSDHGIWQTGIQAIGVYKQATIDRIADSILNGSPSSKRGAKNDRPYVSLVTYEPGLLAGHVVDFESVVWAYSDAIPVRQMTLVFEGPEVARYEVILSHEIDAPWSFIDQFWPKFQIPHPPCISPPCYPTWPLGNPQQDAQCDCAVDAVFDDFDRTVVGGAGTASSGAVWSNVTTPGGSDYGVNGADLFCGLSGGTFRVRTPTGPWQTIDEVTFDLRFRFHQDSGVFSNWEGFQFWLTDGTNSVGFQFSLNGTEWFLLSGPGNSYPFTFDPSWQTLDYTANVWFRVKFMLNVLTGDISAKMWLDSDTEPTAWEQTMPAGLIGGLVRGPALRFNIELSAALANRAGYVSVIDTSYDRCIHCVPADTFNRTTVSPSMGTADCGLTYSVILSNIATAHCDGSSGIVTLDPSHGGSGAGSAGASMTLTPSLVLWDRTVRHSIQFSMDNFGDPAIDFAELLECRFKPFGTFGTPRVVIIPSNSSLWLQGVGPTPGASAYSQITWTADLISGTQIPISFWVPNKVYTMYVQTDGSLNTAGITDGVSTYEVQIGSVPNTIALVNIDLERRVLGPYTTSVITTVTIDNLEVPELGGCPVPPWDSFDRLTLGLGTATAGTPYTIDTPPSQPGTNFGVTPGSAYLNPTSAFDFYFASNANPAASLSEFEITALIKPVAVASGTASQFIFYIVDDPSLFNVYWGAGISATNSGTDQLFVRDYITGFANATKADWDLDPTAEYVFVFGVTPTEIRMKIYEFGDTDPGWLVTLPTTFTPQPSFVIAAGTDAGNTIEWNRITFNYSFTPCYYDGSTPVDPTTTMPTSPGGWGCEEPTRQSSTVYRTSLAFVPAAVFAWRQGLFQVPGTDFTLGSDNQSIVFSDSIGSSEVIQVCYFSQGPSA